MSPPNDIVRALSVQWDSFNIHHLGRSLRRPFIILDPSLSGKRLLGQWMSQERTIRICEPFAQTAVWQVVKEVLHHEMAHQFVSEVLHSAEGETAHGPAFQMVCQRYGIDGRACMPVERENSAVMEKVRKLMALSESSNEHEAKAALAAARRILGEHGLDGTSEEDDITTAPIGPIYPKRLPIHESVAASILMASFGVESIACSISDPRIYRAGVQLEIVGRRSSVARAEHFYACMSTYAEKLVGLRFGRDKEDYLYGLYKGIQATLDAETKSTDSTTALVHVGPSDSELEDFFDRRYPHTRCGRRSRRQLGASFGEGKAAGKNFTYAKPVSQGSGTRMLGKG